MEEEEAEEDEKGYNTHTREEEQLMGPEEESNRGESGGKENLEGEKGV